MTTHDLVLHLQQIAAAVSDGDSLEGSIEYTASGPDEWTVRGSYRIGNLMGQGGMVLLEKPVAAVVDYADHRAPEIKSNSVHGAFVCGAKWWEFTSTGGTMWASDRDKAWVEAERRYGPLPEEGATDPAIVKPVEEQPAIGSATDPSDLVTPV